MTRCRVRVNVTGADLAMKKSAFYAYGAVDPNVGCESEHTCAADPLDKGRPSSYRPWLGRQYTVPGPAPDGSVELRSLNGRCLHVRGDGGSNGSAVQLHTCLGSAPQRWTLTPSGEVHNGTGRCLDVDPAGAVRISSCTGAPDQQWRLTSAGELRGSAERCLQSRDPAMPAGARPVLRRPRPEVAPHLTPRG